MEINNNSEAENSSGTSDEDLQQQQLDRIVYKIAKCKNQIEKLETMEVDFDDERKSSFLELHKYKKKLIKLYYEGCEIKGYSKDAGRPLLMKKKLEITGNVSIDELINERINRDWFNIPGYQDILDCVQFCNEDEDLGMSKGVEKSVAELAYTKIVETLQKLRQQDLYKSFSQIYQQTEDPAKFSRPLWDQLLSNDSIAQRNLNSIFDEYVLKDHSLLVSRTLKKKRGPSKIQKRRNKQKNPRKGSPKSSGDSTSEELSSSDDQSSSEGSRKRLRPQKSLKNGVESMKMVLNDPKSSESSKKSSESSEKSSESSENSSSSDENSPERPPASPLPPILEESSDLNDSEVMNLQDNHQNHQNSAPNFAVSTLNDQNLQLFVGNSSSQSASNPSLRVNKVRGNFKSFSAFGETQNGSSEDEKEEIKEEIEEFEESEAEVMDSSVESVKKRGFRDKCLIM